MHLEELAKDNARSVLENLAKKFGYTTENSFEDDDKTTRNDPAALPEGHSPEKVIELEYEAIQ